LLRLALRLARFAGKAALDQLLGDGKRLVDATLPGENFAPVVFTELYVAKEHVRSSELTLERCLADWEEIKRTLAAIAAESTWAPTPSPLCEWCPFNGNGCEPTREEQNLSLW